MSLLRSLLLMAAMQSTGALGGGSRLQQNLRDLAAGSDGRVGICALDTAETDPVCVRGDEKFPLQSVMKLVVAAAVMDAVDRRQMQLSDTVVVRADDASPGPQEFVNLARSQGSLKVTLEELMRRAVVDSDSTSVDLLIKRLGGVSVVQEFLKRKKIDGIRIDRDERHVQAESVGLVWRPEYADQGKFEAAAKALPVEKRDIAWNTYLKDPRDTATPAGMVGFLKALGLGRLLTTASTEKLLTIMAATATGPDRLMAGTPKTWSLEHKTGTGRVWKGMTSVTNDVGLLTAPDGRKIAVAVFVAESKRSNAERAGIIAKAAKFVTEAYQAKR